MSQYDDLYNADVSLLLSIEGDDLIYWPLGNAANTKTIQAIAVDKKPRLVPAANDTEEFRECQVMISRLSDTTGHIAPTVAGFRGAGAPDQVRSWLGLNWFVIDVVADEDPGFHVLTLRDKCIPKEYEFGE